MADCSLEDEGPQAESRWLLRTPEVSSFEVRKETPLVFSPNCDTAQTIHLVLLWSYSYFRVVPGYISDEDGMILLVSPGGNLFPFFHCLTLFRHTHTHTIFEHKFCFLPVTTLGVSIFMIKIYNSLIKIRNVKLYIFKIHDLIYTLLQHRFY